jgi:hypothetical protein
LTSNAPNGRSMFLHMSVFIDGFSKAGSNIGAAIFIIRISKCCCYPYVIEDSLSNKTPPAPSKVNRGQKMTYPCY